MKRALVTGATSGIGRATAEKLAAAGCHLVLLARRAQRLAEIKKDLESRFKVDVVTGQVDVCDATAIDAFVRANLVKMREVDVLINNAGLAKGTDRLMDARVADWDAMIDTNVKGLLYVTRAVLPFMVEAGRGHVVNLGSVAGRWVYPGGAVYCASKFAVRALTEGLRMDLQGHPIRVTNIEPGLVETEFSMVRIGDADKAKAVYAGMKPLAAADIADSIVWCLQRPAHVNIQELVIFPVDQAAIQMVQRK